jgi:Domain of unknown function (DUF4345)
MLRKTAPGQGCAETGGRGPPDSPWLGARGANALIDGSACHPIGAPPPARGRVVERAVERRLLQISVAIAGLVPVGGGLAGVIWGPAIVGETVRAPLDSHFRYLSGLLAAIGVAYWSAIPDIEKEGARFTLLTAIVVAGGFARAMGMLVAGPPGAAMSAALIMELVVTPLIGRG